MSFTYNDDGIRTSKTVNGVKHTYQLNGSQIVSEQWGDKFIVYLYDSAGMPIGMMYRTTSYAEDQWDVFWYEKNLQGDIVAVYNSSGQQVATYSYNDAWGNHTVSYSNNGASTGAIYNPFRYRGYYYDTDLEMYYLQSRYYDAKICRFINADGYVSTGQGILGNNMFAYCNNNPVNYVDPFGESSLFSLFVISTVTFSILALIPLSILDGLSYEDSQKDALFSETSGITEADYIFCETEVNDITIWNKDIATSLTVSVGACSITEEYDGGLTANASMFSAESSVDLLGGGVGAYVCSVGASQKITILNKEISVEMEINYGAGFDFSIGSKTQIGVCLGVGPSLSIDWDP